MPAIGTNYRTNRNPLQQTQGITQMTILWNDPGAGLTT